MAIDYVHIERSEIEETGEYDLEGLFVRLNAMIEQVGAKRVVLDTIEALFAGLPNEAILRAELRRLFRWLKDKGVTVIITGEQGEKTLTRYGIEEYVSDCVIFLDHRVHNQISHPAAADREVPRLQARHQRVPDADRRERPVGAADQFAGPDLPGHRRSGSRPASRGWTPCWAARATTAAAAILISGTAGTGKTSLAAAFVDSVCRKRRAVHVLLVRGVARADHPQHALHRHRPGPVASRRAC